MWEAAFGPAFFFWGEQRERPERELRQAALQAAPPAALAAAAPTAPAEGQAASPGDGSLPSPVAAAGADADAAAAADARSAADPGPAAAASSPGEELLFLEQQERLRQLVLVVVEAAATLPASSSSLPEVAALLRLLQQHPRRHGVVASACRLLLRLLGAAPATTQAALQELQLLSLLPRLLAAQQLQQQEPEPGGAHAGSSSSATAVVPREAPAQPAGGAEAGDAAALEDARCAAVELLGAFMRSEAAVLPLQGGVAPACLWSRLECFRAWAVACVFDHLAVASATLPPSLLPTSLPATPPCRCSMHVSLQRAAVAAWEPVAALFALLLRPTPASRRLALDYVSSPPVHSLHAHGVVCLLAFFTQWPPYLVPCLCFGLVHLGRSMLVVQTPWLTV